MPLTPETEARGLKAYEQVCAFERLRTWRLPLTFAVFALVPALTGISALAIGHKVLAVLNIILALFLAWMGRFQWKQLHAKYARNLRLLAEMKAEYGDQLPWVRVEKHFEALDQLKRELAAEANEGKSG